MTKKEIVRNMPMSRITIALDQIAFARNYSLELIESFKPEDWFRQPSEGVTHLAWQVGHLAIAEYGLALKRIRGEQPSDSALIPDEFAALFGKGSVPDPDAKTFPSSSDIRAALDRVHQEVLNVVKDLSEEVLNEPSSPPHRAFSTKYGSLIWCSQHEMLHAGQIGLLRRLLEYDALW